MTLFYQIFDYSEEILKLSISSLHLFMFDHLRVDNFYLIYSN